MLIMNMMILIMEMKMEMRDDDEFDDLQQKVDRDGRRNSTGLDCKSSVTPPRFLSGPKNDLKSKSGNRK